MNDIKRVFVTGGAGYVGSGLIPELIKFGYEVVVYDLFIFDPTIFLSLLGNKRLKVVKGDIRDQDLLRQEIRGCDAVIHLACISNDPSFELNPELGKSINFDSFEPLVKIAKDSGVKRFIYASSSSVYGIKREDYVTENLPLEPLTDYSKYKALCEEVLSKYSDVSFTVTCLRPATVCGYASRLRLDVIVNILTNHAYHNRSINIYGGSQYRPNIVIEDMVRAYIHFLQLDSQLINNEIFNIGGPNYTVNEIATIVKENVGDDIVMKHVETNDKRSYRICSKKVVKQTAFDFNFDLRYAVESLVNFFKNNHSVNTIEDTKYFNIKKMSEITNSVLFA